MIDSHCHIDLYPNPYEITLDAEQSGITTIIVTNLPSAFIRAYPHIKSMRHIRLALGLHPLVAQQHASERENFRELVNQTSYIGEVGLDFSQVGLPTKEVQIESFRFVLQTLRGKPKFITLHSRQAESMVLDILEEEGRFPVVFHWYSGPLGVLKRALAQGHFFSINPAMVNSKKGQKIISNIPSNRVLTETDGPFVKVGKRPALPSDVAIVEDRLATIWQMEISETRTRIRENFWELIRPLRQHS